MKHSIEMSRSEHRTLTPYITNGIVSKAVSEYIALPKVENPRDNSSKPRSDKLAPAQPPLKDEGIDEAKPVPAPSPAPPAPEPGQMPALAVGTTPKASAKAPEPSMPAKRLVPDMQTPGPKRLKTIEAWQFAR